MELMLFVRHNPTDDNLFKLKAIILGKTISREHLIISGLEECKRFYKLIYKI